MPIKEHIRCKCNEPNPGTISVFGLYKCETCGLIVEPRDKE